MIIVYGTDLCPDCLALKRILDTKGIDYKYMDITKGLGILKQFLRLRDNNEAFKTVKENALIGVPAIVTSPTTITVDWESYVNNLGVE